MTTLWGSLLSNNDNAATHSLLRGAACRLWTVRYWPEILAALCALGFAVAIVGYALHLPPDRVYVGFVQVDQAVYYACAREYFENGNGLVAANPYSNLRTSPRIYSHLYFLVVGWLWQILGLSFSAIDGIVRIVGAPLMLVLAGRLVRTYVVGISRAGAPLIALALLGGGLGWVYSLIPFTVGVLTEGFSPHGSNLLKASELLQLYLVNFWATEHGYGGWHISLFRNVLYSTEVFYHILFFACILCFLHNRRPLGCLFLFLTCWAHPFTGLLLMLIVTVWLVIEWFYERGKIRGLLAAVLVIDALFLWYNNVFLRLDHEHRSVMAQIQGYSATLPPSKLLPAYGAILPLALVALTPTILKRLWPKSRFRLLYSWVGTAAFLNFHDLFLPFMRPIQPLHFSHGYLYFPLAVLAILVLQQLYAMRPKRLGLVGMLLLLLHLPANVIWSIRTIATVASECPIFAPSRYAVKILEEIDTIADPQVILVDLPPETLGVVSNLIPLFTKHLVIRGHGFNTPFTEEKRNLAKIMMERPNATLVPQLGMTALLTTDERLPFYSTRLSNSLTRTLWHHKQLGVVLVEVVP